MVEPLFINRRTAAVLCGCSTYTLRRYDRDGKLPRRQVGDDGAVHYTVDDLVAAGLLDPLAAGPALETVNSELHDSGPDVAHTELAVAQARIAELTARLARAEDEVVFLRELIQRSAVA
jgi:DNA-binding transcriptional MerR regulator